jgi:hypothetical protein
MRPGARAWVALSLGVAVWDTICPKDEQLTDAAHRGMEDHPLLTTGVVAVTALHLTKRLPPRLDPFRLLGVLLTRISISVRRCVNYRAYSRLTTV